MPRFAFSPIEHDPFDTSGALDYAEELRANARSRAGAGMAGMLDAGTLGALQGDLAGVPNRLMQAVGRVGTRLEDLGNVLMGNRLVVQTPDGPVDVTNDSMIDAGAELSGLVGGTGSLMERPAGSLGVFAGRNAKTADLHALELAKRYKEQGAPDELIWRETGWAQGPDGEWRFEIPDHASRFDENVLKPWSSDNVSRVREFWKHVRQPGNEHLIVGKSEEELRKNLEDFLGAGSNLENILDHPALYEAYPELRKLRVERVEREDLGGYYSPEHDYIAMTPKGAAVTHMRGEEGHGVLLHEIQHAIQTREGFGHGGSPKEIDVANKGDEIKRRVKARMQVLRSQIENSPIVEEDAVAEYANWVRLWKQLETADPGELGYQALVGEVEARNVEKRWGLSTLFQQKMQQTPRETEDTSRAIQWVRKPEKWYKGASGK